jgi:hypothetical protein
MEWFWVEGPSGKQNDENASRHMRSGGSVAGDHVFVAICSTSRHVADLAATLNLLPAREWCCFPDVGGTLLCATGNHAAAVALLDVDTFVGR